MVISRSFVYRASFDGVLRHAGPLFRVALLVVVGDLLTKQVAVWTLAGGDINFASWLRFTLVHNDTAPLGMTFGAYTFHVNWIIKTSAILLMLAATRDLARIDPAVPTALGLIVGAALGNLVSLMIHAGGVVDFIAVGIGHDEELVLNAADVAAYAGLALLLRTGWRIIALARSPARAVISERLRGRDVALRLVGDREIVRTVALAADSRNEPDVDLWVPRKKPQDSPVVVTPIFEERPRSVVLLEDSLRNQPRVIDMRTRKVSSDEERPTQ